MGKEKGGGKREDGERERIEKVKGWGRSENGERERIEKGPRKG
jgi:hypothetical protein